MKIWLLTVYYGITCLPVAMATAGEAVEDWALLAGHTGAVVFGMFVMGCVGKA